MSEKELQLRAHRCCFTGHRPEKCSRNAGQILVDLREEIDLAIKEGFTTFITGMARGTDLWAGQIVADRKKENPDLRLVCAIPYPEFEKKWSADWQKRYQMVLEASDYTKILTPRFSYAAFQIRNEWMVNRASRVIAVYNGTAGGTRNTIEYAKAQGVCLRVISA
ncbi:MAG: DUF1273 family protein [Clostridiales bacterium]|nr:DUF1273 family protein [Clostridiales bacterium]